MDEELTQDVGAESSPATAPPPTPAGAQNTEPQPGQGGQPQPEPGKQGPGPIPYERFKQVIDQNGQLRTAVAQLQGRVQQMEALQQKAQQQGGLSPQDQESYRQAAAALKQIFETDPDLKVLLDVMKNGQQLLGVSGNLQSLREQQLRALERQGVNQIQQLANTAGLPADEKFRAALVKLVEAEALSLPDARQRFASGDLSVIEEAFANVNASFLAHIQREGQQKLLDTKNKTRQLPPAPRGGPAGPPGLPKLDPQNPRAYESALHKAATTLLAEKG